MQPGEHPARHIRLRAGSRHLGFSPGADDVICAQVGVDAGLDLIVLASCVCGCALKRWLA